MYFAINAFVSKHVSGKGTTKTVFFRCEWNKFAVNSALAKPVPAVFAATFISGSNLMTCNDYKARKNNSALKSAEVQPVTLQIKHCSQVLSWSFCAISASENVGRSSGS